MASDTEISSAMSNYIDCKYVIGDPNKGWDCLNFLISFYKKLGVIFPENFERWNLENYAQRAIKNPDKAHKVFERFVQTLGIVVEDKFPKRGDLVLFNVKDTGIYAGVYLGNGHCFIIFNKGGRVIPFNIFKPHMYQIRRLW